MPHSPLHVRTPFSVGEIVKYSLVIRVNLELMNEANMCMIISEQYEVRIVNNLWVI